MFLLSENGLQSQQPEAEAENSHSSNEQSCSQPETNGQEEENKEENAGDRLEDESNGRSRRCMSPFPKCFY